MKYLTLARKQSKRFWSKVIKTSKCWLWQGGTDRDGYGKFTITTGSRPKQIHVRAHRLAYEMKHGKVRKRFVVMHKKCDDPRCVRPSHLRPGTQRQNLEDCRLKGRNATGVRHAWHLHPELVRRGERHHKASVTQKEVQRIRRLKRNGRSVASIARTVGCSYTVAWMIIAGKTWRHLL